MKTYGLRRKDLDLITKTIDKVFRGSKLPQVYLFGSRATGAHRPNSDIDLAIKDGVEIDAKIDLLQELFEDSDLPYKVDVLNWNNVLPEYKDSIDKQKKLIWSADIKKATTKWRPCPIGEHWVRRHYKTSKSGTVGDWDGHCRKNPSNKDILKGDEIDFISNSDPFKRAKPKVKSNNLGFDQGNTFDHLITGWTAYWNEVFKPKELLTPNVVKALIASESGFDIESKAPNKGKSGLARGLVQLTEQTRQILKDRRGEIKDHFVDLKKTELFDPNKNISASVRWLFRKRDTVKAKLKREPSWEDVVFEYKGITGQKGKKSDRVRRTFKKYLRELNE